MYRITYVHKGETKENELYTAGDQEYCLSYAKLSLECGQSGELEIDVPLTNPARNEIICLTDEIIVYRHDEEIWRGRPVTMQIDFNMTGTLICEGILSYLYDTYMPPYDFQGSPKEFVQMVLDNHNEQVEELKQFTLGDVTVEDNNDYITRSSIYYNGRSLEVLTDKLVKESLGGFFRVRIKDGIRYLDYLKDYNTQASQAIEFGVNLLDIAQDIEYGTVASVLLPIGARIEDEEGHETDERVTIESVNGGNKYIVDESAVERYGWVVTEMEWDDVTLPENLLTKGTNALTQLTSAVTSLTVTAVDLSLTDEQIESINLGDLTYIHSVPHNVNQYIELTAINMDLLAPQNDILTFGATSATLTGSTRSTEADVKSAIGSLSQRLTSVSAVYGDFTLLTAQVANIENVLAGNVGTGDLQTIVITTDNAYIDSAVIMDALIGTVLADIIQSNIIYTDEITIMSENGGIILAGTTMQFCDENGTVRLQLGQDASGNFTFVLYDETGSGIMIDSEGIHESAIPDGLIVDDMVSEDANISASKINMAEVTDYLNESGDLVLQAYQVTIDGETLDYKLTQMTQQIDELSVGGVDYIECLYAIGQSAFTAPSEGWTTERLTAEANEYLWWCLRYTYLDGSVAYTTPSLWTDDYVRSTMTVQQTELSVVQGQIEAKIWESDITEAITPLENELTEISDQYGILSVTISEISERVGTLTTTESEHYLEMSSQINDITVSLEGITLEVQDVYQRTSNAIVEGTAYYAISNTPYWYPPHDVEEGSASVLGEMILGQAILGLGEDAWTTEQPEAQDGQYVWISYYRTLVDGTSYWTPPTLLTDSYLMTKEDELYERFSELVLTVDSAVLEVANIKTNLEENYSTTKAIEAYIAEYVDDSSATILQTVSYEYATKSELDNYSTTEKMEATIEQYVDASMASISLSVSGGLGSNASIVMTTDGGTTSANLDLSGVRQAFADDNKSAITISAGTVTFNSNTFICNSTYFSVTAEGDITATSGFIGGWTISQDYLYSNLNSSDDVHRYVTGAYIGTDGIAISLTRGSGSNNMRNAITLNTDGFIFYSSANSTTDNDAIVKINGTQSWAIIDMYNASDFGEGSIDYSTYGRTYIRTNNIYLYDTSGNTWFETQNSNKRLNIGSSSVTAYLYVNGSSVTGSDEAIKKNMTFIDEATPLNESRDYEKVIETLEPILFEYKAETDGKQHIGFTYQNACEALKAGGIDPDESAMVQTYEDSSTGEEIGGIEYNDIVALLVYEVQKLKQQIETLSA